MAPLTDFVNTHWQEPDRRAKVQMFWKAGAYITLSCWPKMERQASFWTSEGFIFYLADVSIPLLQQQCTLFREKNPKSSRPDKPLYLCLLRSADEIKASMTVTRGCKVGLRENDVDNLFNALRRANEAEASNYDAHARLQQRDVCGISPFTCYFAPWTDIDCTSRTAGSRSEGGKLGVEAKEEVRRHGDGGRRGRGRDAFVCD